MTVADLARANSISLEAKKDALSQRQSGDWKVSFTVQGIDMDQRLTAAPMGTRYAMVLVEIGDDELPVVGAVAPAADRSMANGKRAEQGNQGGRYEVASDNSHEHREKAAGDDPTPRRPAREKMDWRDVQPAAQAVLRGKDAKFRAFLREKQGLFTVSDEMTAANAIRAFCGVVSRSELSSNHKARVLWHQLDREYEVWLTAERVGA